MNPPNSIYIKNRHVWRKWLQEFHLQADSIWLIYYKKHTGKPRIPYDDAVEEAICFGWIDTTIKRIDDERFMQKFTPRKKKSNWSEHNIRRAEKMIHEDKMTKSGMAKYRQWLNEQLQEAESGSHLTKSERKRLMIEISPVFKKMLGTNYLANENFHKLAPSHKKQYLEWINSAKREETRLKRMKEAVYLLESGKKLGMK
jgi:uncharacterized protein YdeI (YjbR/CyaY-like superfamily)